MKTGTPTSFQKLSNRDLVALRKRRISDRQRLATQRRLYAQIAQHSALAR